MKLYDNHLSLINIKFKEYITLLLLPIIFVILIILAFLLSAYDRKQMGYIYLDNNYVITIPIKDSDTIIKSNYVMVDNKKYLFNINNIEYELGDEYQIVYLEIPQCEKKIDNQVGTIIFNYNKEKIIKKILRLFF